MRYIYTLLFGAVAFLAMASSAWAASAYDDVDTDHWAYNALEYLTERGVLEGYPDGFFKGDRTLTRYEFAQAVARLLDTIDAGGAGGEDINVLAQTLRAEFSDQLAEISKGLDAVNASVSDLDTRVGDLEGNVADNSSKLSALEEKIACMKPGADWKGSFRYRWQYETRDTATDSDDTNDRFRQRISFMLGYNKQINDKTEVGFRLRTETGNQLTTSNFTLGQNQGRTADIFLDRAYVKYSPTWFGYYTDENCNECVSKFDVYAGIFPNLSHDPNEMIFDDDINYQGLGAVYHFNRDFQITAAASVAVEENTGEFDDDAIFGLTELYYKNLFTCGLDAWVGCYCWSNEDSLPDSYFADNSFIGFDFNNNGVLGDSGDRFSTEFSTLKAGLQYTFPCVWNKPLAVFGEYMINTDSDAEDRIALVNPFVSGGLTGDIMYETTDDTGFVVGAQWGEKPSCVGDWYWFARYKEIGANAIVDGFGDGDAGGANTNSFEAHASWMWMENSLFGITYFLNRMNNAFGFAIPAEKQDQQIIQVDWTFRF
jgi:hypothetical protein